MAEDLFSQRKPLAQMLDVPATVTSVYSMVQHIWAGDTDESRRENRKKGKPRLATVEEYFLDPVRSYLERFLQDVADGEGQGYWLLAHFGVGKSHLMAVESILAIGGDEVWDIVKRKEDETKGLGPAARLDRFRNKIAKKKIFPVIFTLEGKGGAGSENRLVDFVLAEAQAVYEERTGKPLAVTSAHHLSEWYLKEGIKDYENSLKEFVGNKRLMDKLPKFDGYRDLVSALQNPASVEDAATVLRAFLRQKKVKVETSQEAVDLLENAFTHILKSGYDGILVVIDEMSEYMARTKFATEDEDCLLTLSSVLAKGKRLPIWIVVAAQAAYQKRDKIVGADRMREEPLDHKPEKYRHLVINRCRQYKVVGGKSMVSATHNHYMGYKGTIPWVKKVDEETFQDCFPFPPEAVEVIQSISRKLTGTRSTIGFLHSALLSTLKRDPNWNELIPLWRVFDDLMTYQESKSNGTSGNLSVKAMFRESVLALESAQKKLGKIETGYLGKKAGKRRAERILNTIFLYHVAGFGGLTAEQILDAVCDLKSDDGVDIQVAHYEQILEEMKGALGAQVRLRDGRYEFVPKETGEFDDILNQAAESLRKDSTVFWNYVDKLLDYSEGPSSPFSAYRGNALVSTGVIWHGQQRSGQVGFRDLTIKGHAPVPDTASSEHDFVIILSRRAISDKEAKAYLKTDDKNPDPRVIVWTPATLTDDQKAHLISVLAYLKVVDDYRGTKHEKEARGNFQLHCDRAFDLLKQLYQQGKARTTPKTLAVDWTGGLEGALERMAGEALDDCYKAAAIDMGKRIFKTDEAIKLINGLVKLGKAVPASDKLYSAVENFAKPLKLVRSSDPDKLDLSNSEAYKEIRDFAESKAGHPIPPTVFYNNFTGWLPENGKQSWGLTRRMVDIYLLVMAQQGVIRINLKKGPPIDRTTVAEVDFKPEALRNFDSIELPKPLVDWEQVAPYLATMVQESPSKYGPKYDQVAAHEAITRVKAAWLSGEKVDSLLNRVSALFRDLDQADPYDDLLSFWMEFFEQPLDGQGDQELYEDFKGHLLKALGKEAAEDLTAADLKRFDQYWKQLQALQEHFDDLSDLVRCAGSYAKIEVPDDKSYRSLEKAVKKLSPLVERAKDFVIDPDRANAELKPALGDVWKEYDGPYQHGIGEINAALSDLDDTIKLASDAKELHVLQKLSSALPDATIAVQEAQGIIAEAKKRIFKPLPEGEDLKKALRQRASIKTSGDVELRFTALAPIAEQLQGLVEGVSAAPSAALTKVSNFLNDKAMRSKLEAYLDTATVKKLLACLDSTQIATKLSSLKDSELDELAKVLEAVLKGTDFVVIRISDFKPKQAVIWDAADRQKLAAEFLEFIDANSSGKIVRIE
ncbi:MAG: hypothetical protein Q7J56_02725 [Deltaproteobacteria bacterium]|nr:hypothetical protein [Deltaproteobacteria bacterium]